MSSSLGGAYSKPNIRNQATNSSNTYHCFNLISENLRLGHDSRGPIKASHINN